MASCYTQARHAKVSVAWSQSASTRLLAIHPPALEQLPPMEGLCQGLRCPVAAVLPRGLSLEDNLLKGPKPSFERTRWW